MDNQQRDIKIARDEAYTQAYMEAYKKGETKVIIKMAKKALSLGLSIELISKITKLSESEIEKFR